MIKSNKYIDNIKKTFESKATEELLDIWQVNDRDVYSKDAFVAVRHILTDRNVNIPEQTIKETNKCVIESTQDLNKICAMRKFYLVCFLISILTYIACWVLVLRKSEMTEFVKTISVGIITISSLLFMLLLLATVRKVRQYSMGTLVFMAIGAFIPFISSFIFLSADFDVYSMIIQKKMSLGVIKRALSPFSIYSLIFSFFPFVGLPLALFAFREIKKSKGVLYGSTLAVISILINLFVLSLYIMKWFGVILSVVINNP